MAKSTIFAEHAGELVAMFVMYTNEAERHRPNTCGWRHSPRRGSACAASYERRGGASALGPTRPTTQRVLGRFNDKAGGELAFRPHPLAVDSKTGLEDQLTVDGQYGRI